MIIIEIQHANPYYDDSYAVNSANLGPYGDAITYELVPFIEKQFRGIGKGLGAFYVWRLNRRLGSARRADFLSGRIQRRVGRLSGSDRFSRLHHRQYLRARKCLLRRRAVETDSASRANETT